MAKRSPPRIDPESIPKRQDGELNRFMERLYFRIRNNVADMDAGDLNAQWVALEALGAILPVLSEGLPHKDVKGCYPIESWRENTVEVPVEILEVIVSAWEDYLNTGKTLGQSFGFEKLNRQGVRPMKTMQRHLNERRKISNAVLREYIQIGDEQPNSLEEALAKVAEDFGISASTAERAFKRYGQHTLDTLEVLTKPKSIGGMTSRIADVDE